MKKSIIFLILTIFLCFCAGIAYSEGDGTFLSRICEYDAKKTIGLKSTGNYIIKSESISYYFYKDNVEDYDEDENIKIIYRYIIKKNLPGKNNTFGLSLRNRDYIYDLVSDEKVENLTVLVNGKKTKVNYKDTPYEIIDDNLKPIKLSKNWLDKDEEREKYVREYITNGYIGWYYFNVDFPNSDEASIEINYESKGCFSAIRYDSKPFWIPVSDDTELKVLIEKKGYGSFLSYVTGCTPMNTLVTDTWRLEKPNINTVVITYAPGWFTEYKKIVFWTLPMFEPRTTGGGSGFFDICIDGGRYGRRSAGVNINTDYGMLGNISYNISERELGKYEFIFLNEEQLRIMYNSFYARYKYRFIEKKLNEILYNQYWRGPIPDDWFNKNFSDKLFTPIERKNMEIIQNLENMKF